MLYYNFEFKVTAGILFILLLKYALKLVRPRVRSNNTFKVFIIVMTVCRRNRVVLYLIEYHGVIIIIVVDVYENATVFDGSYQNCRN